MFFKKLGSINIVSVVVFLSIVFIGMITNLAKSNMDKAVISATLSEMNQIGVQLELLLEEILEESEADLSLLAEYVEKNNIAFDEIGSFLKSQSQSEKLDTLYYIDPEGAGYSLDGDYYDFSDNEAYIHALNNEFVVTEPQVSFEADEMAFDFAVPVIIGDELVAVLYSEAYLNDFLKSVELSTEGTGDVFIVNHELSLVFSTSENHLGNSFIPDGDISEMGMDNVLNAQTEIIAGTSGGFYYDYYGTPKVMVYFPIQDTEWALAMNVEIEGINATLTTAIDIFKRVSGVVYWTVIAMVFYVTFANLRAKKKMVKTVYYDTLTALPNMAKLNIDVTEILEKQKDKRHTILIFDIENFKAINEMFGREVGDRVLKGFKSFFERINAQSLIGARIGDDKFAMFADEEVLNDLAPILEAVSVHFDELVPELVDYSGTFKIGRYNIDKGETDFEDIMTKVNLAHQRAKNTKGEMLCDYDETFKHNLLTEAEITNKMKSALDNKEFKVYLQPKFSTNESALVGAEALVRWIEADGKIIFPNDFIPLFERNGFIVELDKYILENVCMTIRKWIDDGLLAFTVSVNCSRLNLENPFFVDGVVAIADKYNVPHGCIEIELTESTTITNERTIEQLFLDLRQNGFKISIDDFGAGYSSLGMLKNLHVDTLKMDRSFFIGGKNARRDDMLIDSIVKMSHNLGMYVVAEGIETQEQVDLLRSMNCDAIQGYVHAKPMPISEFEEKYNSDMLKKSTSDNSDTMIIRSINDTKFANSLVACGILITDIDDNFTILEANDYYFEMIGYTREEVRDKFGNSGLGHTTAEKKTAFLEYFDKCIQEDPYANISFTNKFVVKSGEEHTFQLSGKVADNEHGQRRLYLTVTDITLNTQIAAEAESNQTFTSNIASLLNDAYFDFDNINGSIRFSENFATKFNIPEKIDNFTDAEIREAVFPGYKEIIENGNGSTPSLDGQFCMLLPSGAPVWYIYHCETIYDESGVPCRTIGKMTEVIGTKLEMEILRVKSEADALTSVYNKRATERYISSYLRIASRGSSTGAFLVVNLDNFTNINEVFGREFGDECLKEVGKILRNVFRNSDIIGRISGDEFFVFIGNYKTMDFIEKKAAELCLQLHKRYEKDGKSAEITASVGVSLYPEHGDNFKCIYEKATKALQKVKQGGKNCFAIYDD